MGLLGRLQIPHIPLLCAGNDSRPFMTSLPRLRPQTNRLISPMRNLLPYYSNVNGGCSAPNRAKEPLAKVGKMIPKTKKRRASAYDEGMHTFPSINATMWGVIERIHLSKIRSMRAFIVLAPLPGRFSNA